MPNLLNQSKSLKLAILRLTRTTYAFIGLFLAQIIIFDSWNLISHDVVTKRWSAIGFLAVVNTAVWLLTRGKNKINFNRILVSSMVLAELVFCSYVIYWDRGMASTYALLFILPILSIGVLRSRTALLGTATLSTVAYSMTSVKYFNDNYGEGYDVQLWGQIIFFGGLFYVIAWMIMILVGIRKDSL